ncbi:MAG: dephospho-CoA kinase [Gammaproteobacteria bacterium]|nr:dephospho-CoA kinase [Gammaproteobacteria bacterium]
MLVVGLTGGIGCGKSAVSDRFAALGVPVIDADLVAREVVAPGQPALREIAARFGEDLILADGTLDRAGLRSIVFDHPDARQALESILHPRIRATMRQRLEALDTAYAILAIPLLLETGQSRDVDRVLVVDCSESVQIARVTRRDKVSEAQARAILAVQTPRQNRLQHADDIIDNSGTLDALEPQIDRLHARYLELAASH